MTTVNMIPEQDRKLEPEFEHIKNKNKCKIQVAYSQHFVSL